MPDSVIKVDNLSGLTSPGVGLQDGSVSSPSLKFSNDGDTGLYRIGSNDIGVSAGGSKVLELDPNTFSTFQGGVERFRIASNGQISAVVPGNNILYNGFMCRAWVSFDGTLSGTITPRGSGNISSITKNGTGSYTVNFLTPMPDVNYAIFRLDHHWGIGFADSLTTNSFRLLSYSNNWSAIDVTYVWGAVFR